MNRSFRIPTILALSLIAVVMSALVLFNRYFSVPTQADSSMQPKQVQVTNVSDSGFTVSWITDKPSRGFVNVQTEKGKTIPYFDERESEEEVRTTHNVAVRGLVPQTTYTVSLLPNQRGSNPTSLLVSTFPSLKSASNQLGPAFGTILLPDGTPAKGALVYLTLPGSQTVSTVVKPSGTFLIPLNLIRSQDGTSYLSVSEDRMPVSITVIVNGKESLVTTDTLNDSPVPDVVVGESYDFRGQEALKKKSAPVDIAQSESFSQVLGEATAVKTPVTLTNPSKGAAIASEYPLIAGTGVANNVVTVSLGISNPQMGKTTVGSDGTWKFYPKQPVGIGNQSVTITSLDEQNKPVAITHLFEILKSGTRVLGDATPSGIPVTSTTPSPIVTLEPTAIPTPTDAIPTTATVLPTVSLLLAGVLISLIGILSFLI